MTEAVQPLQEAMGRLTESTQSLPLILGAATERLASRIETTRMELEETLIALMADAGPGGAPLGGTKGAREQEVWGRPG